MTELILLTLAAYRLGWMYFRDEITRPLRTWLSRWYVFRCSSCLMVWLAGGTISLWKWGGTVGETLIWILAICGLTGILDIAVTRLSGVANGNIQRTGHTDCPGCRKNR